MTELSKPNLIFFGTPAFAVPSLLALLQAGYPISAVVTQPDRPAGRGYRDVMPPVKLAALKAGLPVYQPQRLKEAPELLEELGKFEPMAMVVVAFGQILPVNWLSLASKGCLNIHASLLPAYRGAAPVQWALINGERQTGVTIMRMERGLDTGPVLSQEAMDIPEDANAEQLLETLSHVGARLLVQTLPDWLEGRIPECPQEEGATYAPMLTREMATIDWHLSARQICDRIRGQSPWPGAQTSLQGEPVKIKAARVLAGESTQPGRVCALTSEGWEVETGDQILLVTEVHLPGKRPQRAFEAAQGLRSLKTGVQMGR